MTATNTPKAEVITIGDEILYGQIIDTNSQWLGEKLSNLGVPLVQKTTVSDNRIAILEALAAASKRADVIITTGGLGPTKDDITKKTLAEFFGVKIAKRPEILEHVSSLLEKYGLKMDLLNETQAELPENAEAITNHWGTAPGMWFEFNDKIWISMPGVPREMKAMMEEFAFPKIQKYFRTPHIQHNIIRTVGIPESQLAPILSDWENSFPENLKLAYLPRISEVRLRLTASAGNKEESSRLIQSFINLYPEEAKKYTYAFVNEEIE